MLKNRKPEFNRFIAKVQKTDSCWLWTATKYRGGYGHFGRWINNEWKMYKSHRYSYEFYKGIIPDGMLILHTCDNPSCVNPAHLIVGTHKENTLDMITKGRRGIPRNALHNHLNEELVNKIRLFWKENTSMKQNQAAKLFGISAAQFNRVVNNKIWKEPVL